MTTGERMKERRKSLGISAEYIAEKLNVSPATIYRYENGEIEKMPGNILEPISILLHTTPAYLMGWEDTPTPTLELTQAEAQLVTDYRDASDEIRCAAATMLHNSAETNRKEAPSPAQTAG